MDLTSPKIIKEILSKYQTRPSKGLGQNFLVDKHVLDKIIAAADLKKDDTVLEVGPGVGTLTQELAQKAGDVIAVEKDETMIEILKETLENLQNVKVINNDILKFNPPEKYKLIANIPYYLTSPLIRKFLEEKNRPEEIVLMIQKEVAQRICSNPPDMSILAVSVQFYADAKIISYVSKGCFLPVPKVDSAIIKIVPHSPSFPRKRESSEFNDLFFKVVKAGFSHPRKQIHGNLSKTLKLIKGQTEKMLFEAGIKPSQRAETLSMDNWINLTEKYKTVNN